MKQKLAQRNVSIAIGTSFGSWFLALKYKQNETLYESAK